MVVEEENIMLNHCPNFNRIVNFEYAMEDSISKRLIRVYKDYIFRANVNNEEDIKVAKEIDYVLGRYIDDYAFRRELRVEILNVKVKKTCTDILKAIVESIIHIFDNYLENSTKKITLARWI